MTFDEVDTQTMPGTPALTNSRSSKSSSFHSSYHSDNDGIVTDGAHFEEIGLEDDIKNSPIACNFPKGVRTSASSYRRGAAVLNTPTQRDLIASRSKPAYPTLRGQIRNATANGRSVIPTHRSAGKLRRGVTSPVPSSFSSLPRKQRNRSTSPKLVSPRQLSATALSLKPRRESWQSARGRKTANELERECDEDDGDDVPDECLLENVPMSPRPPKDRSRPPSTATSPEPPKERIRSIGNGTSPIPAEQGEFRSPRLGVNRGASIGQFPINHLSFKPRTKSWTDALSELSDEAKALTQALEAHADDEINGPTSSATGRPYLEKGRVKSAIAELPPLRRTDIMIDPLPCSKEKEAVLSRTRPSWLPPKDPLEEKRHLKEYQRMMASSAEAEKRREAQQNTKTACRDDTACSLLKIWEEHVLPNWTDATRQKRTRELWWRGIAPRSRGVVWSKAIGNELGLSDASYNAALRRARALETTVKQGSQLDTVEARKKSWLDRINQDACSTYSELRIFQPEGPLHQSLLDVLKAYAMYRNDVGYIPGTNTAAALLLLNLPSPQSAFLSLANLLNRSLSLSFHTSDHGAISKTYTMTQSYLLTKCPLLHAHLTSPSLASNPDLYLRPLFTSLFTSTLSLDCAARLWDIMVFEGDAVIVRAAVAVLAALEGQLFGCESGGDVVDVLEKQVDITEDAWVKLLREAGRSARKESLNGLGPK